MIAFRFLLLVVLTSPLSAHDPWLLPRSTSFHHTLELFHARARTLPSTLSLTLPSLLPFVVNGTTCQDDLVLLFNGFKNGENWALKIVDSWGTKPSAGILEGSHLWLGSYDECLHSLYLPLNRSHAKEPYPTKYCTLSDAADDGDVIMAQKATLAVGVCLPSSCRSNDFRLNRSLALRCRSGERRFTLGALLTLTLVILLGCFICFASFIPRLKAYSAVSSLKMIFSLNNQHSTYSFLNGIRALSLLWIIFGHTYVFQLNMADNLIHIIDDVHNSWTVQFILGAVFAVDTFFFISGFLAVYVLLNTFKDPNAFRIQHVFLYYFHRYCRLIPTLVFVLLISMHLSPWMGSGPMFPTSNGFETPACHQWWWMTILFVNNAMSFEKTCLSVTWYIANDFQFHLLAPLLLIPFILNRRRMTYGLLLLLLLINIITTVSIVSTHAGFETSFTADDTPPVDFFTQVYIAPWCRIGAFIIGMLTRLIIERSHPSLSSLAVIACTSLSVALGMICLFFPFYSNHFPKFAHILYQSLSRQCWSIAIGWLAFACCTNHGGLVNRLLSWPLWTIVARLSYSAYLIHSTIILALVYNRVSTIHYQASVIFNNFAALTILSLLASVLLVVLVEAPFSVLEKRMRKSFKGRERILTNQQSYGTIG